MVVKRNIRIFIVLAAMISIIALVGIQRHFHNTEINLLIEKANEHNVSYELVIHNKVTKFYSFRILN